MGQVHCGHGTWVRELALMMLSTIMPLEMRILQVKHFLVILVKHDHMVPSTSAVD